MLQKDPWLPWSPLSRTTPQKGISAHAGPRSSLGRLCALYTSKLEPQLGQSCWRLFIWLKKQGNCTPRPALDFGFGQLHLPEWGQSTSKGCCSYLGACVSPGHHWRESLALLLDSLECPVQATMVLVFWWHPLEGTAGRK